MSIPRPVSLVDDRVLPITLDDLKDQLRIEHDDFNRLLKRKIEAATNEAEQYLGSAIIHRSFTLTLDGFPSDSDGIELSNPPVVSITSAQYYDSDGVQQTLSSALYALHLQKPYPCIELVPDASWPDTQSRDDAVTVTYVAGYAAAADNVPPAISEAIVLRAATRTEMSEEEGTGTVLWRMSDGLAFESLLRPYRLFQV